MKKLNLLLTLLFLCLITLSVQAQNDTIYQKPQLPTGPPGAPGTPVPTSPGNIPPPLPPSPTVTPPQTEVDEEEDEEEFKEPFSLKGKLLVGGSGGLSFSSSNYYGNMTFISISPMVGYKLTEKVTVGPGLTYQYLNTDIGSFSNYGGRVFGQFSLFNNLFNEDDELMIHAEYEILNVETVRVYSNNTYDTYRSTIGTALFGLGYRQAFGSNFYGDLYLLYNASESPSSPYGPIVLRFALLWNI